MPPDDVKVKPSQVVHRYIGIDVTQAIDTIAFGHLWNEKFGWFNLLWELDKDSAYSTSQLRIDKAHLKMPIKRMSRTKGGQTFTDTVLMPMGIDGKSDPSLTSTDLDSFMKFMQTFVLEPSADKSSSELNDTGKGVVADLLYLSSHGFHSGTSVAPDLITELFNPARAASVAPFAIPGWLVLSNCGTLDTPSHAHWEPLMRGSTPLRGIVGFQDTCPPEIPSADFVAMFIDQLSKKQNIVDAWNNAVSTKWNSDNWAALCHTEARNDTVSDWNSNKLPSVSPSSSILLCNKANPKGTALTPVPDPYPAFWSKGGTRVSTSNMNDPANRWEVNQEATITIQPQPPATQFADQTKINVTLIFIRPDYPQNIDVNKLFSVTGQAGIAAPSTDNLNPQSPGGDDSYKLVITGTPKEVTLTLKALDFSSLKENGWIRLRIEISGATTDFTNSGISVKK